MLERYKWEWLDAGLCYNYGVLGKVKVHEDLFGQDGPKSVIGLKKKTSRAKSRVGFPGD